MLAGGRLPAKLDSEVDGGLISLSPTPARVPSPTVAIAWLSRPERPESPALAAVAAGDASSLDWPGFDFRLEVLTLSFAGTGERSGRFSCFEATDPVALFFGLPCRVASY